MAAADRPDPDPVKLLEEWMTWEKGEQLESGRLISNLKKSGMKELLESLARPADAAAGSGD